MLVAKLAIFLQTLGNDAFQFRRQIGVQRQEGRRARDSECRRKSGPALSPRNGAVPVAISYITTPKEKRSVRASSGCARTCSGDMYASVPTTLPGTCQSRHEWSRPSLHRRRRIGLGQTEVEDLRGPGRDEQICRLDVAVDDPGGVRRLQRPGQCNRRLDYNGNVELGPRRSRSSSGSPWRNSMTIKPWWSGVSPTS